MADAGGTHGATTLAVVVSAGVSAYLPRTLQGLAAQTSPPDAVLVVDTSAPGGDLGTGVPLTDAVDAAGLDDVTTVHLVRAPGAATFGAAVRAALAHHAEQADRAARRREERAVPATWLWLLHDDSEPAPPALAELLRTVESGPSIGLAGVKQRDWARPDRLLEVGLRATASGRRVPDIEDGEIDQGQHDDREDVLAVGTAGAFVRREVWDALGGPDPALGPFGDGLDLSRRARLAGYRVVVVPTAVVHHARAAYLGLRSTGGATADVPDERRSFAARRRAQLYSWIVSAPAALVPLVVVAMLALAPVRALWRVATKDIALVAAEMRAPAEVLVRPGAVLRARRRNEGVRTVARRHLRPLYATWRDVGAAKRDARRAAAAARTARRAPSEIEIAERAALGRRRRGTLAVVVLALVALAVAALAPLLTAGTLTGGALLPADAGLAELWGSATSTWVAAGLGHPGPADPLLLVLAAPMLALAPFGGSASVLVPALLVLAVPLAGLGAWYAAGAATRSVLLRAWAAALWALAPPLLLGVGHGRLGPVVAHLALPWVALGVARAVGAARTDAIPSGLAGAPTAVDLTPERPGGVPGTARPPGRGARGAGRRGPGGPGAPRPAERARRFAPAGRAVPATAGPVPGGAGPAAVAADAAHAAGAARATSTVTLVRPEPPGDLDAEVDRPDLGGNPLELAERVEQAEPAEPAEPAAPAAAAPVQPRPTAVAVPNPAAEAPRAGEGSLAAAAGAALALAVATAGAPVLLPVALVVLAGLALVVRRGRRRLALVPIPSLVLLGPLLAVALRDVPGGSWRVLLTSTGAPFASDAGPGRLAALGWPTAPGDWLGTGHPQGALLPLAGGAALVVLATLALLRGSGRARAIRGGWFVALVGLLAGLAAARVDVGVGTDLAGATWVVRGWAGPGASVVVLGLLTAVVAAGDGMRSWLTARSFGWRQVSAVVVLGGMVLGPVTTAAGWVAAVRRGDAEVLAVSGRSHPPVPALAVELQNGPDRARVLALSDDGEALFSQVWRGTGPQLTEAASVVAARGVEGGVGRTALREPDAAASELASLVSELAVGTARDAGARLGALGIGVVLVPPVADDDPTGGAARDRLVAHLDATAGVERVTENGSGVIWRVSRSGDGPAAAASVARARILDADGAHLGDVAAGAVGIATRVPHGPPGRTLVLAERADPGWQATYNGRALRATSDGWRQAFELPAHTGELAVRHEPAWQAPWRLALAGVLPLAVLLALPLNRRREVAP